MTDRNLALTPPPKGEALSRRAIASNRTVESSDRAGSPPRGEGDRRARGGLCAFLLLFLALLAPLPAFAVNPDEILANPVLEQRARNLSAQLRCMVCQNQSIDDSNAELARDLRVLVRERLVDGDTDGQVLDYVVSRYGEFVLLNPRLSMRTMILWGAPLLLLIAGIGAVLVFARSRPNLRSTAPLTPEEQARINELLDK